VQAVGVGDLICSVHSGVDDLSVSYVRSMNSTLWSGWLACCARHATLRSCCFARSAM